MTETANTSTTRPIVVVLGMHRSGTSLCAHLLSVLGFDMCDDPLFNDSNPAGHWERWEIVGYHDRILRLLDRDYYSSRHALALPVGWWAQPAIQSIRDELIPWLRNRMGRRVHFGFKDPRTSLMLPVWEDVFKELQLAPRYILCIRDPVQVIRSVGNRDNFLESDSEYRWVAYNAHSIIGVGTNPVAIIPFEEWFTSPQANLDRIARQVGLDTSWATTDPILLQAVNEVINPSLRHDSAAPVGIVTPFSRSMYSMLTTATAGSTFDEGLVSVARSFIGIERSYIATHSDFIELSSLRFNPK